MLSHLVKKTNTSVSASKKADISVPDHIKERTLEMLTANGEDLTWEVEKIQLVPEGNGRDDPDSFGLYKDDMWLGTVGSQYQPLQNSEMVEILLMAFEDVGEFGEMNVGHFGFTKVYLQAQLDDATVGKNTLKRWLTFLDFKNGGGSLRFGATNTDVWCSNTFALALKELAASRFKHTGSIAERVKQAAEALAAQVEQEEFLIKNLQAMEAETLDKEQTLQIVNDIVMPAFNVKGLDMNKFDATFNKLSTRSQNKVEGILKAIDNDMAERGNNMWGLFSGVTYLTNHVDTVDSQGRPKHDPYEYVSTGTGYGRNRAVYEGLTKLISAN